MEFYNTVGHADNHKTFAKSLGLSIGLPYIKTLNPIANPDQHVKKKRD